MIINLTYTPGYANCHESDWSLVNKILRLNFIEFTELRDLLLRDVRDNRGAFKQSYAYSEMSFGLTRLRKISSLEGDIVDINKYINSKGNLINLRLNWRVENSKVLKYCPVCIKSGFHSPYYMSPYLSECPIHDVKLETKCPSCSKEIPHILSATSLKVPYGCPNCGFDLYEYKNSPSLFDVSLLDDYIANIDQAEKMAVSWSSIFNYDQTIVWNSNNCANLLVSHIVKNNNKNIYLNHCYWSFVDNDSSNGNFWPEVLDPWDEQSKMSQNSFIESIIDTLHRCFFEFQEDVQKNHSKHNQDITRLTKSWARVWERRISTHQDFGRLYLASDFILNKIVHESLYKMCGLKLMRHFEIMLVNALFFQLYASFKVALMSKNDNFEMRYEIESFMENVGFYLEKSNDKYIFHAFYPNIFEISFDETNEIKSFIKGSINESPIYEFCLKSYL